MNIPTTLLLTLLQALPISPSDVEKIAKSDIQGILVWTAYVAFGTMFSAICALAFAYKRSQDALRDVQEKSASMLLEFGRAMAAQMENMKAIPLIIERHERSMAEARSRHEDAMENLVREVREEMRRIMPNTRRS